MLKVCHLYPELLNLYGDRGNVMAFARRCRWRGLGVEVLPVNPGDPVDFREMDFLFLGGGSDREQNLIARDLEKRRDLLQAAVEDGLVVLAICGGYQLLGRYYRTLEGRVIPGLGLLDLYTEAGRKRMIGNVVIELQIEGEPVRVVGFENHAGRTFLGPQVSPLGRVLVGCGNNGEDGTEGARYSNVFCSYLHGPLLPKNPRLVDYLISLALARRGLPADLAPLDDSLENAAAEIMLRRLLK
ncbi:type 1 glutamine amidotransferase [Desulfofundulus thermocisternus]|uniref:type 1 glutamine amidotransferase n=1 Tax=Desulfofundulus thermocisternus TaxID=42471 RepID=UPI0019E12017|nr:glutamine amidotransferase [Desulfofundulus thermocisternus]MBE3586654.1 glutamine amidotransferase [Thermoanaerobacter sp.]MCS5694528.1 glutamine amidotransferase [Desulfofundulus thermocisternus]